MRILIVANGDPSKRTTWSGVPSMVVDELRQCGHEVICLDSSRVWWIVPVRVFFNRFVRKIWREWRWIPFEATKLGICMMSHWVSARVREYRQLDLVIGFTFCLDSSLISCPVILIHDWTNGYMQSMFHVREMSDAERETDAKLFKVMRSAKKIIVLYPKSADYIRRNVGDNVFFYCNPVNTDIEFDLNARLNAGKESKRILLIGGSTYIENVYYVVDALERLSIKGISIDVVGEAPMDIKSRSVEIVRHGYLNKDQPEEKDRYYNLIKKARCLVNVRRGWGGGSSIAEALRLGLPVIAGRYQEIETLYGPDGDCVLFCSPGNVPELTKRLKQILDMGEVEYIGMCKAAIERTKGDTYKRFVKEILG